jgi:hypothetical protein
VKQAKHALPVDEKFLTGRMTFEYELDDHSDMPTTTYRSKEDCPKPPDHIVAGMDAAVRPPAHPDVTTPCLQEEVIQHTVY